MSDEVCYSGDKQSPSVCWQRAAMPSGRQWLKGRHHPWAQSANAWSEDTDDTPALWRREQRQCLFLVWKCPIPLIDSLVVFVGRVSHIARRARMALDSVLRWGQWICPCGWKMSYLAECSCMKSAGWGLPSCTWWRVLTLLQQCRADPGDPLQGMSEATHSTHTHTELCAWWIRLSWMQGVGWVHDIFSFETIATTKTQILELELKCISHNKHLSLSPDLSQKSFKRKRSIINWAFWRGPGTHLDNAPLSSTSAVPGKLFGLLLTTICEDDNLPKPLLVSPRLRVGSYSGGISLCGKWGYVCKWDIEITQAKKPERFS